MFIDFLAMSGGDMLDEEKDWLANNGILLLDKPFTFKEIHEAVASALSSPDD